MASHPYTSNATTIFLTQEETERIRQTVKSRIEKCVDLSGHQREPRDSKDAIKQATGASLMADMGGVHDPNMAQAQGTRITLPVLTVGQPYPPCTVASPQLERMKISGLKMETHHRGKKLVVRRSSPVVALTARSWTMVQDADGEETERLEVCLHNTRHGEDVLESGKNFVIKEPFFTLTDQGEATVRIYHPSDLIVLKDETHTDNLRPASMEEAEKVVLRLKEEGNSELRQYDLPSYHAKYTMGLKMGQKSGVLDANAELMRDIARNRALVNLQLGRLDEALSDACASFTERDDQRSRELDSKAYYRAGCAAYGLRKYQMAQSSFENQLQLNPGDKGARVYLSRIKLRRAEEEGKYQWTRISAKLSRSRPRADVADFLSKTSIKESAGKGRGLFAICNISEGQLVLCEKAFCIVWSHERDALTAITYDVRDDNIRVSPVGLTRATVQKLMSNPSYIDRVMQLRGIDQRAGNEITRTNDGPVVGVFHIHDIISRNAFGSGPQYEEEDDEHSGTGLWLYAAYINHSCIGNVRREHLGDLMVLRASRDIVAGEEILHPYTELPAYEERQAKLMDTWGFHCDCDLCTAEKADDPVIRRRGVQLSKEADCFVGKEHWADAKSLTITRARRLARAIDDTYDPERYKGLPRSATQQLREWLTKAAPQR